MNNQKVRNFAIVAVAAMLLATTAISIGTTDNAFAYKKNQATSQANACGNDLLPTNIGCQNTGSQVQGDENGVALAAQQTFPEDVIPVPPEPPIVLCILIPPGPPEFMEVTPELLEQIADGTAEVLPNEACERGPI